jgi:site-specific recombinase XerD
MNKPIQTLKEHILERHSERAVYGYLRMIRQYLCAVGPDKAARATYPDITAYIETLRATVSPRTGGPLHPKTLRNHLYAVKMYYQWLLGTGQRNDHPCRDLFLTDKIDKTIAVENLLTKEQLDELLQTHRAKVPLVRSRDTIRPSPPQSSST